MSNEDQELNEMAEEIENTIETEGAEKPAKKRSRSKSEGAKGGIAKKPREPKPSKPRRPFSRLPQDVLEQRRNTLQEKIDVAKAQITIMTNKWQKYEDEMKFREQPVEA